MGKRKHVFILVLLIMVLTAFSLTACGDEGASPNGDPVGTQDYEVELYFGNQEYIITGDESLDKLKDAYKTVINSTKEDVYFATVQELRTIPEEDYDTALTENVKLNDVHLEGNTIIVDFDSIGLNGGSLSETFLITQIVETLRNSFDEVKKVQFLVDGEQVESLMGHVDASKPFEEGVF